jgi:hypothetical protein
LYGSYEKIEAGFCAEAMRDLTGAPTRTIATLDRNNKISEYFYD